MKVALEQSSNLVIKYSVSKKGLGGSVVLFKGHAQITKCAEDRLLYFRFVTKPTASKCS